jgi:hypothetical protein
VSIHTLSWVLRHSEERLGNRLVLLALAEHSHDDGSKAFPTVETLMKRARLSRRAVQSALRSLEQNEAIEKTGSTAAGVAVYRVVMGGADSAPQGAKSARGGAKSAPEPSSNRHSSGVGVGTVGGKIVTDDEAELAGGILAAFNDRFDSDYRGRDHVIGIIGRIRERPDLTLGDFRELIEKLAGQTWWRTGKNGKGKLTHPTPRHIFGSGKALDFIINAKPGEDAEPPKRRSTDPDPRYSEYDR